MPPIGAGASFVFTTWTGRSPPSFSAHALARTPASTAAATRFVPSIMRIIETSWVRTLSLLSVLEQGRSDDQPLDLAGALVNLGDLRVAKVPLDGKIGQVAIAAEHLH